MEVPVGHPNFGRLIECDCKIVEREDRRRDALRRLSSTLDGFSHCTFDNFEDIPGTREAFEAALQFARDPDPEWPWLYLHGRVGVGKTHLAAAAAQEIRKRHSVYFAVVPDLLDHLRMTFDPSGGVTYDERFNTIREAYLLVLDDLGTENTTPWAREKLYQIINYRYVQRLPTIVTSNQDHRHVDERILSRLLDTHLTRDITIDAEDFRRRGRSDYTRGLRSR
jgi:DNA replication protein DnaC